MNASDIVRQFGINYGIAGLALNDRGQARIGVDGTLEIELEWSEADQVLHVFSILGVVPEHERSVIVMRALAANLFGAETQGATIGFDSAAGELILCDRLRGENPTAENLKALIESLIDAVEHLRRELFSPGAPTPTHEPRVESAFMMRA